MDETRVRPRMSLPRLAGTLLRVLAGQFLLGEILSIYVTLPFPSPMTLAAWLGVVVLLLHILLGIVGLGIAVRMVLAARQEPQRRGLGLSLVALVGLIAAFLAGASFTLGSQADNASFVMALGFYLALLAGALILGRPTKTGSEITSRVNAPPPAAPGERGG